MGKKPTYEELELRVKEFENEAFERKQAEEALRESEEQYRTLVDNLPVAVYRNTPGPEGAFLMANPAFCKMFGFKNEEEVKKVTPASIYDVSLVMLYVFRSPHIIPKEMLETSLSFF